MASAPLFTSRSRVSNRLRPWYYKLSSSDRRIGSTIKATIYHQNHTIVWHDLQRPRIRTAQPRTNLGPGTGVPIFSIQEEFRVFPIANYHRPIRATRRRPYNIRGRIWNCAVLGLEQEIRRILEFQRAIRDAVVHRVSRARQSFRSKLVGQDILAVTHLSNDRHAWTQAVVCVYNIIYHGVPGQQVAGGLVRQLLGVERVA